MASVIPDQKTVVSNSFIFGPIRDNRSLSEMADKDPETRCRCKEGQVKTQLLVNQAALGRCRHIDWNEERGQHKKQSAGGLLDQLRLDQPQAKA